MKLLNIYLLTLLFIFIFNNNSFAQNDDILTKEKIRMLSKLPDDTNKVNSLNKLVWKLSTYDSLNTNIVAHKSIALAKKLHYLKGLATAQKNLAAYYYYTAEYQTALDLYQKSLKNYDSCENKHGIAISYRNIGNVYSQIGSTKEALKFYFKSLNLREEIGDTIGIAKTYSAIGNLYVNTKDYKDSAIVYFKRALKIFKKTNSNFNIASTYLSISSFYYDKFLGEKDSVNYKLAIKYARKSIKLSQEYSFLRFEGTAYEIIGNIFTATHNNDSAYFYLKKSLDVRKTDNNVFGIVSSLSKLGNYFLQIKNYSQSENYLLEANDLSLQIGTDQLSVEIYNNLSNLYYYTGNYKKAFEFYNKYTELNDSLQNKENTKQLTQMAMQFEFDKKQKIVELEQQKKDELTKAEIKRQKIITFFLIIGLLFVIVFAFFIFRSYQQKKKNNEILRDKNDQISMKNALLQQKNEEIEAQKDEIEAQKDEIEAQRDFLDKQNKEITASINYAQRIQEAVLTPIEFFKENFKDYFILYNPRDIVSGDFYWATKLENKLVITVADCTGHGVPGAFMSLLGISFLNQIVNQLYDINRANFNAANILNKLRDMIVYSLGHGAKENEHQEGMDMSLIIIDYSTKEIEFSGAYNPLILIKNNELEVIPADRMPVGFHFRKMEEKFTNHIIHFEKDTKLYMLSDGLQDQFGGPDGRKLTIKKLKQFLLENNSNNMKKQKENLSYFYNQWAEGEDVPKKFGQIDDILVMGIKL